VDVPLPIYTLRGRLCLLRDIGAVGSPFNSWLFIQGLETLKLRMKEHSHNALMIAKFLETHPKVKRVNYPGLPSNKNYKNAQRYFDDAMSSGLLSFEVKDLETAKRIVNATQIYSLVVNIGDSKSIITHPASTTHQQLSPEELEACGVPAGLIRISAGLENAEDLVEDLKQALEAAS
jgi:O-acetylhomoserine (thiol)-lyase